MNLLVVTPLAAFAAGLATSPHCAAMCSSLVCALRARPLEYHAGRLLSYSLVGMAAGAVGSFILGPMKGVFTHVLPWVLIVILVTLGFGLERRIPQPPFLASWLLRVRLQRSLGLLTPLLPCGPLWLMLGAAAASGSWQQGGGLMAAFTLGTIPLPWLLLGLAARWRTRLSPVWLRWCQQGVALLSAAILLWRVTLPVYASCH